MKHFLFSLATCGPLGYLPASGTLTSAFMLPPIVFLFQYVSVATQVGIAAVAALVAFFVLRAISDVCPVDDDPPYIVIDELVGCLWTAIGLVYSIKTVLIGFCAFRFFDTLKCAGVGSAERISGPVGVIADDCVAGLYACVVVHLFQRFII